MNQFNTLTVFGIAVIMLVLGVALGSIAFPVTKIETMTHLSSVPVPITQTETTTQHSMSTSLVIWTTTITNTSSTSSACTYTGGIGCPHFFNQTFVFSVEYNGAWGLSYQGYLGAGTTSGNPIASGNFFGHGSTNESITVSGTDTSGITACVEAQKLDASSALLTLKLQGSTNLNQTSLPYGTIKLCTAYAII